MFQSLSVYLLPYLQDWRVLSGRVRDLPQLGDDAGHPRALDPAGQLSGKLII